MDKLLHDSLTVHLENFGYENIPKLENYNDAISSMIGVPKIILDMSDKAYENWRKYHWKGFEEPVSIKEKEDKKMITAEEARKITCENRKIVSDLISMINKDIKTAAEDGKWVYCNYFNEGTLFKKYLSNITEILMDNGYDVSVMDITAFDVYDNYDYQLKVSWKEEKKNDKC